MRTRIITEATEQTHVLALESGDDVLKSLSDYAAGQGLNAARFTGLGAFERVVLGYFDWQRKDYDRIRIEDQVEVVSLIGDIAVDQDGKPSLHPHVVVSRRDGSAWGGHLLEATVRPILEVVIVESPACLQRFPDRETGLALLRP
ncbi:MAG: PPC domain-containing DNA-binding protein [Burkholderiaceae bacterium]